MCNGVLARGRDNISCWGRGAPPAVLQGRQHATIDDVRAIAYPVLRHRLRTNFNADAGQG